ncbi:Cell division trigger factor [Dissulfuribacter thermophilus]|uniref:Trigger factor n=1 Tax=Dissulfuribacter thermophilus TaxID=1156395 RepID=A0A1B9F901_9BACT|nr:trigger factor [Dissulfuribacter thermophilus]OCC16373.1 Cell division trigger factor [Dissulfuribacter thermophilus]
MKVTVEDVTPVQKKLQVEIPGEQVALEFDKACKKIGRHVKIKGFRKGKAPKSLIQRYHGDSIREEVLESLIRETFPKALEELDVKLITEPRLENAGDLKEGEPFSYSALLDLWPEFDLPEYKGIKLEKPPYEVTEEEVDEQMEALRKHFGSVESLEEDRPVQEGDLVIVDFEGFFEGEPVEGLKEENYYLEVGSGYFNEEFETKLIGTEKGVEKEIEVTYPEDALNENVAGKTITYKVTVKEIKKRILPELDDEFAQKFGPQYKTIDDLRERMRNQLEQDKKEAQERAIRQQLIDKLLSEVDFPLPESLVEKKLVQMVDNVISHLNERGMDLQSTGMSEERLKEKMREDAERQVKMEIVLDKIADKEDITVSNEELMRYMEVAPEYRNLDPNQIRAAISEYVLPKLRAKNTIDFLLEHAEIVEEEK